MRRTVLNLAVEPIRVYLNPASPEAILLVAPRDAVGELALPPLPYPFVPATVAAALGAAGVEHRLSEQRPAGPWGDAIRRAQREAACERRQRFDLTLATTIALAKNSADDLAAERGELLRQKAELSASIAELKSQIAAAQADAHSHGRYLPRDQFRLLETSLEEARRAFVGVEGALGANREAQRRRSREAHEETATNFAERFVRCAKVALDRETFLSLCDAADAAAPEAEEVEP